jgi:hypothetical protein
LVARSNCRRRLALQFKESGQPGRVHLCADIRYVTDVNGDGGGLLCACIHAQAKFALIPEALLLLERDFVDGDFEGENSWPFWQADQYGAITPELGHHGVVAREFGEIRPRQAALDLRGIEPPRRWNDLAERLSSMTSANAA